MAAELSRQAGTGAADRPHRPALMVVEAGATGAWLGLTQVSLAFALMSGAGGSATMFFLLTGVWIAGGAVGVSWGQICSTTLTLATALASVVLAKSVLGALPFHPLGTASALVAGLLAGAYAGAFFRHRSVVYGTVRALLFHENNGFVAGYLAAGAMLFYSSGLVDLLVFALGGVLIGLGVYVNRRCQPP